MKTIDELHALWQSQLPALTIPVMNRLIAVYPNVLDDVNCPVTWGQDGVGFHSSFPYMGYTAYLIIDVNGLITHSDRPYPDSMLPTDIIAAIQELCPGWTPASNSMWTSPVLTVRQIANPINGEWNGWNDPAVDTVYQITFDSPQYTPAALEMTQAYQNFMNQIHPKVTVSKTGVIV